MYWYNYLVCFISGIFLANAVPHFIHGISGNKFPTPFAKPRGKGLSSPFLNILWAFLNFVIGGIFLFFYIGEITILTILFVVLGSFVISVILSIGFQSKHKE